MIWFTADQHFNHANIIKYCNRPFKDVQEMNNAIIHKFNSKVRENDITIHLGDFCLSQHSDFGGFVRALNGKHWFIRGNHDKISFEALLKAGFVAVLHEGVIKIGKHYIRLAHYPYKPTFWDRFWFFLRKGKHLAHYKKRPTNLGNWLIHGHTHSTSQINYKRKSIHVGVDAWEFYPVCLSQIANLIKDGEKK